MCTAGPVHCGPPYQCFDGGLFNQHFGGKNTPRLYSSFCFCFCRRHVLLCTSCVAWNRSGGVLYVLLSAACAPLFLSVLKDNSNSNSNSTNNQQQLAPFLRSDGTGRGVASHTPIHRRALRLYTYLTPNVATVSILIFNPSGPHNSGRSGITLL